MTVLHYAGVGLFAEVARIDEEWPRADGSRNAVVVLSLRALPDVPSSVAIKALRRWAGQLKAHNGRLIVSGVTPAAARILQRGGLDEILGEDGIVPAGDKALRPSGDRRRARQGMDRRAARRRSRCPFFST